MRTFVMAGYALSRFLFRVKCFLTGDPWRETAGLWGLHLLDLKTLEVFPDHPRQFLPSAVWRAQRKELERGQGSRFQGVGGEPYGFGGLTAGVTVLTFQPDEPSPAFNGQERKFESEGFECNKCGWTGAFSELLDGEACPRCRLVL